MSCNCEDGFISVPSDPSEGREVSDIVKCPDCPKSVLANFREQIAKLGKPP